MINMEIIPKEIRRHYEKVLLQTAKRMMDKTGTIRELYDQPESDRNLVKEVDAKTHS